MPLNTHVVPLFRLYTYAVVQSTDRLEDLPRMLLGASYLGLVATMPLVGRLVRQATGRTERATPLEAAGAATVVCSASACLLVPRQLALQQPAAGGLVLRDPSGRGRSVRSRLVVGSQHRVSRAGGKLTVRGALGVVLLVLVLGGIQGDRAERLHIETAPPLAPSESGMFWSSYMRNARATYLNAESSEHLRRALARLDRVEQIALREGIGKATIRRVFGRVLVPGIPAKHTSDAASLLRIPEGETNQSSALVKKALSNWYKEELEDATPVVESVGAVAASSRRQVRELEDQPMARIGTTFSCNPPVTCTSPAASTNTLISLRTPNSAW